MNSFDRLPQIPSDYANHVIYGGITTLIFATPAYHWLPLGQALLFAVGVAFFTTAGKKIYDYFTEHETVGMCVAKVLVT